MAKIPFTEALRFDPATTLFVSDLDGTLLTPDAVLPTGAADAIADLYRRGVRLTYATARTIRSAAFILEGLPFPAPIALMIGIPAAFARQISSSFAFTVSMASTI